MKGLLYLFPNLLCKDHPVQEAFVPAIVEAVLQLDGLIAESPQGGRSFLYKFKTKKKPNDIPIATLNEHTKKGGVDFLLEPVLAGECWGVVSDSGMPCIADPGAELVAHAHNCSITIKAFPGPSSIMMALVLSGMQGQRFSFWGYLSRDPKKRKEELIAVEKRSRTDRATQLFIEAPYRNVACFQAILDTLRGTTRLCVATNIASPSQYLAVHTIAQWQAMPAPHIHKIPTTFLVEA
ncbi:SAM-dependent methyltransferase [Simkania negevensis]|uniref:SAM-dependent methyltransferase n=1 Tax=Simkania negevensis TaxID=83561 RepID=A0ABS3AVG6_9BACT|nr:SAM-dependent methyltransferase [Simkania negevensis]